MTKRHVKIIINPHLVPPDICSPSDLEVLAQQSVDLRRQLFPPESFLPQSQPRAHRKRQQLLILVPNSILFFN